MQDRIKHYLGVAPSLRYLRIRNGKEVDFLIAEEQQPRLLRTNR